MRFYKTIKFRVNLWYVVVVAIIVLFFSIATYFLLSQRVSMMNFDAVKLTVLKAQANPAAASQSSQAIGANSSFKMLFAYTIGAEQLQEIRSTTSSPFEVATSDGIFSLNQRAFVSSDMAGPQEVWLYFRPVAGEPGSYDILVVTQAKAPSLSILAVYKRVLYIAIPLTLIFAGLLGYFLIRRLLRPLSLITRTSKEIQENGLDRRIKVTNRGDELGELSSTLNQTFGRLQTAFAREHQFTSDTSHELRAPLAIVQGEATLALNQSRSEEDYRQHLESISQQVSQMSSLVSKLLFLDRADSGRENLTLADVSLKAVLSDIVEVTRFVREAKGLKLISDLPEDAVVKGDEVRLRELFLNLVDNAIKYTPSGGEITLSLAKEGGLAKITVKDTGPGISEEHLPHLFERFYRVNKGDGTEGNGLGLAICRRIAELHKGNIEVQSKTNEGTAFTVVLPLATD